MTTETECAAAILDQALKLAEQHGWENVRLHDVAQTLGISLDEIRLYYREKEDLVEAWFDRADSTMLRVAEGAALAALPARQRLHRLMMAWFDALAPHRDVTRQMLVNKLEPGHLHVQIPAILRISRTVQWLREAAGRNATFLWRALEETGLTGIYLMTFLYWLQDDSPGHQNTARRLARALELGEPLLECRLFGGKWSARTPSHSPPTSAGVVKVGGESQAER